MFTGLCHFGSSGALGSPGGWGWIGMILTVIFWVGLLAGLTLLVVWALRRSPGHAAAVSEAAAQAVAQDTLKVQSARSEITHDQYEALRQDSG